MRLLALAAASLALPALAYAETGEEAAGASAEMVEETAGVTFTGSLTFSSAYVSDGVEYSDGPVVQPYLELGYAGFYAGIWASNAEEDLLGADSEVDLYVGYRGEAGIFYYDIGYGYYTYPNASELNSGEVLVSGGAALSDTFYVTAYLAYSNEFDSLDRSLRFDYYTPVEGLAVALSAGDNDFWRYWTVGGSYALTDIISADLTWHDNDIDGLDGLLVGGVTFSF